MVPIREVIEAGAWLLAEFEPIHHYESAANDGEPVRLRIRVTDFSRIDLSAIDHCEELSCRLDSNVWKLGLDVVSLCRREWEFYWIMPRRLFIVDGDGFEYMFLDDNHLRLQSDYAKRSGLYNFFALSTPPKIRKSGAFPYELPDEIDQLFLKIRGGSLREA